MYTIQATGTVLGLLNKGIHCVHMPSFSCQVQGNYLEEQKETIILSGLVSIDIFYESTQIPHHHILQVNIGPFCMLPGDETNSKSNQQY